MRVAIVVLLGALTGIAGWWTLFLREQVLGNRIAMEQRDRAIRDLSQELEGARGRVAELDREVDRLGEELRQKAQRIRELELAMFLLKVDHRVARIEVLAQGPSPQDPAQVETTVRFTELDRNGAPVGEGRTYTLAGRKVYLETLVIKFEDEYVEGGDFLRGSSVCLFKSIFSEQIPPEQGHAIDSAGAHPASYGGDAGPDLFHAELWQRFWDYANDPELAEEKGVRALHGEAPFVEARPGRSYRVELRASGGLAIRPE
jgi:hypothetical protein